MLCPTLTSEITNSGLWPQRRTLTSCSMRCSGGSRKKIYGWKSSDHGSAWVVTSTHLPLICGRQPTDPHHLRFAQSGALGRKVSDEFAILLCRSHHPEVRRCGDETAW